jgi:hypothetical protein
MNRTVASAVEILTWINKRLTDHPACAGFILDGVLNQLNAESDADPTWELGMMRGDAGPPSHDCLECLALVLKEAQRRFTLE